MSLLRLFRRAEFADPAAVAEVAPPEPASRRERGANAGSAMVDEALAQKLLHAWLQNRHQTLVPLTLNFRVLSEAQRELIVGAMAALLLAGRPRAEAEAAQPALREWLAGMKAEPGVVAAFDAAMLAPPPLDQVMDRALALDVTVFVFVAALAASDARFPASLLLCDVLEARFELPSAVARSAIRRYRRA